MQILHMNSFPIEQVEDLQALEERLGGWFAAREYPIRLIAHSHSFDMQPAIRRLRRDQAYFQDLARAAEPLLEAVDAHLAAPTEAVAHPATVVQTLPAAQQNLLAQVFGGADVLQHAMESEGMAEWALLADALARVLWPLPWMKEMIRFYEALGERHIRSSTYLLLTWEPPTINGDSLVSTLKHATGRDVTMLEQLPTIIHCPYTEEATRLKPHQPGHPWLALLMSYDMRGTWNATTLHAILNLEFDVAIAVDIHTLKRGAAMRAAEFAYNAASLAISGSQKDVRGERILFDAELVMHALTQQALHDVQITILVTGETADDLNNHIEQVKGVLGTSLKLTQVAGVQGELLKYFTTRKTTQINAPLLQRNLLSNGLGCLVGVIGYHRANRTDGILWGLDGIRRAPLFFDLFGGNQAGHTVVLGKTGYGKTWFINMVTMRGAAIAGYKIIGIDAFKNGERIETAAGAGATCNWIGLDQAVNILDIVVDPFAEGGWIPAQVAHVIAQLSLLLGSPGRSPEGKEQLIARDFSIAERGLLSLALTALYERIPPTAPLTAMPILSDMITVLEQFDEDEAEVLVRELRFFCYGRAKVRGVNIIGQSFNRHSTVDWNFSSDINYFDFSGVPELYRAFYYAQAIGAVNRYMRDPRRDVKRRTLLIIDEFGYATQVQAVAQMAAEVCKVARKYGIALMVIDQNPTTFLNNQAGLAIWENTRCKIFFHLDDKPARLVGETISDLTPSHVEFLSQARRGECVYILDNDVYVMLVETNLRETRAFQGS